MLNLWRRAWRKDTCIKTPSTQNESPHTPSGTENVVGRKRSRSPTEIIQNTNSARPKKKPKPEKDSISLHLPEFLVQTHGFASAPFASANIDEVGIARHALEHNTIAIVPSAKVMFTIMVAYVGFASVDEKRPLQDSRYTLVIVEDAGSVSGSVAQIRTQLPDLNLSETVDETANQTRNVVVSSANSILDRLKRGVLSLNDVHSLVVYDLQNIKDQDSQVFLPAAQIMKKFYHSSNLPHKPHVLAFFTPHIYFPITFDSGMLKLEELFDSRVYGAAAAQRTRLLSLPNHPRELVVVYDVDKDHSETKLLKQLHKIDPEESIYPRQYKLSKQVLIDLGPCGADLVWRRALNHIKANVVPWYDEDDLDEGLNDPSQRVKVRVKALIGNWEFSMPNLDVSSHSFNVTPKFLRLIHILKSFSVYGDAFRGIIFVRRRITAFIMVELLRTLDDQISFIRSTPLTSEVIEKDPSRIGIIRGFAAGTINLLVVTKAAEDIDIPKAQVVIRFDLFDSEVSLAYLQSRSRGRESHIISMIEKDNDMHRRIISQSASWDTSMLRWVEKLSTAPESAPPPRPLRESADSYHSDSEDEGGECLRDPTTSRRIEPRDATSIFYHYISNTGPNADSNPALISLFRFSEMQDDHSRSYICKIILNEPRLTQISGKPSPSMALARRNACFEACVQLNRLGLLDYRYFPFSSREIRVSLPRNIESTSSGTRCYDRKQPEFWENARHNPHQVPQKLYPIVVNILHNVDGPRPYGGLLVLTWQALPPLLDFHVFFSGVGANISLHRGRSLCASQDQINHLYRYTLRLCRAISNKPLNCALSDIPYLYAPLENGFNPADLLKDAEHDLGPLIDWTSVRLAANNWVIPLKRSTPDELSKDLEDAIIQDRWVEFTRRYEAIQLRTDLTPLSKPVDSPREASYQSLLDFCYKRCKGFEGLRDESQPIIEVDKIPPLLNHLNPRAFPLAPSHKYSAKYLIPELCAKFTVPASVMRTALLLPSIHKRIDEYLLVKELNTKLFNNKIKDELLHVALTAPAAGLEFDYERLELLGDAFLKYLSSIYVFVTNPTQNEGALHSARGKIISNKALYQSALEAGLPPFIQAKPLAIKMWQPTSFKIKFNNGLMSRENQDIEQHAAEILSESEENTSQILKNLNDTEHKTKRDGQHWQWLGDKAIADVVEAIIGAAYISGGRDAALEAVKALHVPIYSIDQWSDFGHKVLAPPAIVTAKLRPGSVETIEAIIGHRFEHPHLLAQALTHHSFQGSDSVTYERFEFIGDAILDFLVIRHIFDREERLSPGGMTLLKGAMVSNSALAAACVLSGLQKHLLFDSPHLASTIRTYCRDLKTKQIYTYENAAKEERNPGQFWLEVETPKALSDVVESVIGAVYVADNFNPVGAEVLYDNVLKPFYDKHISLKTLTPHPTKSLLELIQAHRCQSIDILKEKQGSVTCCSVVVHDVILAAADDTNAQVAARRSSLYALDALEGDPSFLDRYCDCRMYPQAKRGKKGLKALLSLIEDEKEGSPQREPSTIPAPSPGS